MAPHTKFSTLLSTLLLSLSLLVLTPLVSAAPFVPPSSTYSTHRRRTLGRRGHELQLQAYNPQSTFKTFGKDGVLVPTAQPGNGTNGLVGGLSDLKEGAMAYVASLGYEDVMWRSGFRSGTTGHAYIRQAHNGIPFANAVCNIGLDGDRVATWGSSFVDLKTAKIAPSTPTITWRSVLPQIEAQLDAAYNDQEVGLEYFVREDGSVSLVHVVQAQNKESGAWYEAFVDAHSGELVSVTDFVADATYTVLPITKQDFTEGLETLVDPQDLEASPEGWHALQAGGQDTTTTSGNNVVAVRRNQLGAQRAPGQVFDFEYDDTREPTDRTNIEASKTNAFYVINAMHDMLYKYGWTEEAFNFQVDNFGKGGRGRDRVEISVQDGSGTNNANFATPPDGIPGQCRMFIWTLTSPQRDGTMENDIIIHEYAHGLTNRMTGGGTGRCLQTLEAGGMGEGWGDAIADWFAQESPQTVDFALGKYVLDNPEGLRTAPYSTSAQVNPLRYSSVRRLREVHSIGEVWANILHNVYAALVSERGFTPSPAKLQDASLTTGNVVWMQLLVDALALQPCNPTFVQARDAWIQADEIRYNGANRCTLFRAFASRGLGLRAANFVDDATIPADC